MGSYLDFISDIEKIVYMLDPSSSDKTNNIDEQLTMETDEKNTKFKVGDKVRLASLDEVYGMDLYDGISLYGINLEVATLGGVPWGSVVTIEQAHSEEDGFTAASYTIKENGCGYLFPEECFTEVINTTEQTSDKLNVIRKHIEDIKQDLDRFKCVIDDQKDNLDYIFELLKEVKLNEGK